VSVTAGTWPPTPAVVDHSLDETGGDRRSRLVNRLVVWICLGVTGLLMLTLAAILAFVVITGLPAISITFLTQGVVDYNQGGALAAILGSLQLVPIATLIATPIGVLAGVYLAEGGQRRFARVLRFCAELMYGLPPVVIGIFAFTILVAPFGKYSAIAGALALAVIMLPIITRAVEEVLLLVPGSVREASLALGIPAWRTVVSVVIRTALGGILTAVMLAVARAAGETASLIFTAYGGGQAINAGDLGAPTDSLPTFIYYNSRAPDDILVSQASGASLLLLAFVLLVNVLVRGRTVGRRAQ
jgi:phosphate transport system permease protein